MTKTIALAGKGGTGKTTVAGLIVKYLIHNKKIPVLAVDADANANLNDVLGVDVPYTLGDAREEMKKGKVPSGMTKNTFISMKLEEAIIENNDFDLLVMGQPEGSGCYCAANTLLSNFIEKLTINYPYLIIDNEAGMEHISRLTIKNIDTLLIVSDSSQRSIKAALRINNLTKNLGMQIKKSCLLINKTKNNISNETLNFLKNKDLDLIGFIPENEEFYKYDLKGLPTFKINEKNTVVKTAYEIFSKIF